MTTISRWARTDAMLAELLSAMLKSEDLAVGMAIYQSLAAGGSRQRQTALLAAAEEALSAEDYWLVQAVIEVSTTSRNQRNDFAHHLWGVSDDVPNALLLVDPKVFVRHLTMRSLYSKGTLAMYSRYAMKGKDMPSGDLDHSRVQVYFKPALQRSSIDAIEAGTRAFLLNIAVDRLRFGSGADATRDELLNVPAIRREFERLSSGSKKATPPQPHPKKPSAKQRRIRALARKK